MAVEQDAQSGKRRRDRTELQILTGDRVLSFDESQRARLHDLGVNDQQIRCVEAVLGVCRSVLRSEMHSADMADVRDEFDRLERDLAAAAVSLGRVLSGSEVVAVAEALERLSCAEYQKRGSAATSSLGETLRQIEFSLEVVRKARSDLGTRRRVRQAATWWPIQAIHQALQRGWGESGSARSPDQSLPHLAVTTPGSPFVEAVSICYEVICGNPRAAVPERAIRSYVAWYRENR